LIGTHSFFFFFERDEWTKQKTNLLKKKKLQRIGAVTKVFFKFEPRHDTEVGCFAAFLSYTILLEGRNTLVCSLNIRCRSFAWLFGTFFVLFFFENLKYNM